MCMGHHCRQPEFQNSSWNSRILIKLLLLIQFLLDRSDLSLPLKLGAQGHLLTKSEFQNDNLNSRNSAIALNCFATPPTILIGSFLYLFSREISYIAPPCSKTGISKFHLECQE